MKWSTEWVLQKDIFLNKGNTRKSLRTKARGSCPCLWSGRMATGAEPSDTKEGMRSQRRRGDQRDRQWPDHTGTCSYGKPCGFYPKSVQNQQKDAEQRNNISHSFLTLTQCAATINGSDFPESHLHLPSTNTASCSQKVLNSSENRRENGTNRRPWTGHA